MKTHVNLEDGTKFFGWTEKATHEYVVTKHLLMGDLVLVCDSSGKDRTFSLAKVVEFRRGRPNRILVQRLMDGVTHLFTFSGRCWDSNYRNPSLRMIPMDAETKPLFQDQQSISYPKLP